MSVTHEPEAGATRDGAPRLLHPAGWPRPKGFSYGVAAQGRMVLTGGVIGWDGQQRFPADFVAEARQIFENIRAVLAEGGASPHHLVRLTWYVVDMDEYLLNQSGLGRAYRETLGVYFPPMALVQVVRLVEPRARLEIEATAIVGDCRETRGARTSL